MILYHNWQLVDEYLTYRRSKGLTDGTVELDRSCLHHLLQWADATPLKKAPQIEPPFQIYVRALCRAEGVPYSASHRKKILKITRAFLRWLKRSYPSYRRITEAWIDELDIRIQSHKEAKPKGVSLELMRRIAAAPTGSITEERAKFICAFLYLSAMRITAFTTLPLKAVDVEKRQVEQLAKHGVRTKNQTYQTTYLLEVDFLLPIVAQWYEKVAAVLPPSGLLCPAIDPLTHEIYHVSRPSLHRATNFRKQIQRWLAKHELPYVTFHQFRHGYAAFWKARMHSQAERQALIHNMMHKGDALIDSTYGRLTNEQVADFTKRVSLRGVGEGADSNSELAVMKNQLDDLTSSMNSLLEMMNRSQAKNRGRDDEEEGGF
ncbi:MAG TPA: hypothetical protein VLL52_22340 [Anaerolineae bacterium]|nr:hypothetical protein [Anaerolineae bacterium]